jgi:hypothetical protein
MLNFTRSDEMVKLGIYPDSPESDSFAGKEILKVKGNDMQVQSVGENKILFSEKSRANYLLLARGYDDKNKLTHIGLANINPLHFDVVGRVKVEEFFMLMRKNTVWGRMIELIIVDVADNNEISTFILEKAKTFDIEVISSHKIYCEFWMQGPDEIAYHANLEIEKCWINPTGEACLERGVSVTPPEQLAEFLRVIDKGGEKPTYFSDSREPLFKSYKTTVEVPSLSGFRASTWAHSSAPNSGDVSKANEVQSTSAPRMHM